MAGLTLHTSHIHVPWRNSQEWRNVYEQVFTIGQTRANMKDALNTLCIWKTRMPRLYSGIEGTLIILKGLLGSDDQLADDLQRQLLASSVMRFLNVCLSRSSRNQETFFHIARTKNLPEWIVNIRHDFTHSQRLPSAEMLIRALEYCLQWLKVNYWDPQADLLEDYVPDMTNEDNLMTIINLYEQVAIADENHHPVTTKLKSKLKKFNIQLDKSKYVILNRIAEVLRISNSYNILSIPDAIIKNGIIFNFANISEDSHIAKSVVDSWLPMISALSYYNILLQLLKIFIGICCKNESKDKQNKSAAWLKTLFKLGIDGHLEIFSAEDNSKTALKNFAYWAIAEKNAYMKIYLNEILILADFNETFIMYTYQAIEALTPKPGGQIPTCIYSIENIKSMLGEEIYHEVENELASKYNGWQIVKDTSFLNGIPIGGKGVKS